MDWPYAWCPSRWLTGFFIPACPETSSLGLELGPLNTNGLGKENYCENTDIRSYNGAVIIMELYLWSNGNRSKYKHMWSSFRTLKSRLCYATSWMLLIFYMMSN